MEPDVQFEDEDLGPALPDEPLSGKSRAAVIHRIRSLVNYWGITREELEQDLPPEAFAASVAPPPGVVKYRHPRSGDTWDGQGAHPQWLRDALLKEGFTVAELKPAPEEQ